MLLEHLRIVGLLKLGGRQRTDSTHILAAVRALNRYELAGASLRQALESLAMAAPDWRGPVPSRRGCGATRAERRMTDGQGP